MLSVFSRNIPVTRLIDRFLEARLEACELSSAVGGFRVRVAATAQAITQEQSAKTQKSINNLNILVGSVSDLINVSIHCYDFISL